MGGSRGGAEDRGSEGAEGDAGKSADGEDVGGGEKGDHQPEEQANCPGSLPPVPPCVVGVGQEGVEGIKLHGEEEEEDEVQGNGLEHPDVFDLVHLLAPSDVCEVTQSPLPLLASFPPPLPLLLLLPSPPPTALLCSCTRATPTSSPDRSLPPSPTSNSSLLLRYHRNAIIRVISAEPSPRPQKERGVDAVNLRRPVLSSSLLSSLSSTSSSPPPPLPPPPLTPIFILLLLL
eukprot:469962-Hanusia_phi.AAC.1